MKIESVLFTPIQVGKIEIPNRFVRSATHDFMANRDGSASNRQVTLFENLARGEVGLIITGHAYIHPAGIASPFQTGVDRDDRIDGLSRITEVVHQYPSRIFLQLSHAGRQTTPKICGCTPLAPSAVYEPTFKVMPKEMNPADIRGVIDDFIQASRRAEQSGFDGVQLHIAHGYLLSSFISPYTNRRTDEWGGSLSNRLRIVREIIKGIKESLEKEFPLIVKLNSSDFLSDGLTLEESIEIAKILEEKGVDGIEVSGGMAEAGKGSVWKGLREEDEEGYFVDSASMIKEAVSIPVIGLGGIRTFSNMERFIDEGNAALVSMSRPLIRDPFLVKKFHAGEIHKSECISCNKCFNLRGISCADLKE
jgi:2,4-dienoyl-CoA reductase-like NADH-dependent reductase (Old Yellow Enzyme family)